LTRQAAQELRALFASIKADGAALGKVAPGGGGSVESTRSRALTQLRDSEIRAARATGDHQRALALINAEMGRAGAGTVRYNNLLARQATVQRQVQQSASGLSATLKSAAGALGQFGIAFGAQQIIQTGFELAKIGAQAQTTRTRFDQLAIASRTTGNELLSALRQASGGTISDTNLQLAAMRANVLGVADSAAELSPLLAIARDRAQLLGLDTGTAFANLVEGLGKAEPEILDNLGITLNLTQVYAAYAKQIGTTAQALTVQQKSQALTNEVLRQGKATLDATGGEL
jgi:hypothetical protein